MRRDLVYRDEIMDSLVKEYNRKRTNDGLKLAWIEKAVNDVKPAQIDLPDNNVGELISRRAAIDAVQNRHMMLSKEKVLLINDLEKLPPAEPKRETATVSVGKSKGGVTMWYECAACGEPVDQGDTFCSGCGRRLIHE